MFTSDRHTHTQIFIITAHRFLQLTNPGGMTAGTPIINTLPYTSREPRAGHRHTSILWDILYKGDVYLYKYIREECHQEEIFS